MTALGGPPDETFASVRSAPSINGSAVLPISRAKLLVRVAATKRLGSCDIFFADGQKDIVDAFMEPLLRKGQER